MNDFRDDELDLPYYLANFHRVANSVALSGPRRGFIDMPVWRDLKDNQPYNARIMESILSLVYFYCTDRPWNIYRGDPALRRASEAALDFWTRSQRQDGRFSEYAPDGNGVSPPPRSRPSSWARPFGLLHDGPPIDSAIHRRAIETDRRRSWPCSRDPTSGSTGRSLHESIQQRLRAAHSRISRSIPTADDHAAPARAARGS